MNVTEALTYIHSVCWKGSIPGLSRTKELLARMGNPENGCGLSTLPGPTARARPLP